MTDDLEIRRLTAALELAVAQINGLVPGISYTPESFLHIAKIMIAMEDKDD